MAGCLGLGTAADTDDALFTLLRHRADESGATASFVTTFSSDELAGRVSCVLSRVGGIPHSLMHIKEEVGSLSMQAGARMHDCFHQDIVDMPLCSNWTTVTLVHRHLHWI